MLIENLKPSALYCAGFLFYPGINSISDEAKKKMEDGGYWTNFLEMAERGMIRVDIPEKLTTQLVEKTYDVKLLESWLDDAPKGLRRAIEKQLGLMKQVPEGSMTITVG